MKNLNKEIQAQIIVLAGNENFWGKRLRSVKLDIAQAIKSDLELDIEEAILCDWLIENKPVTPKQKKALKVSEPVEPTFKGTTTDLDSLIEVLPDGKYIITAAQNNTAPHAVLDTLKHLADEQLAKLLIMPIHYVRNLEKEQRKAINYHADVKPFLVSDDLFLGNRGAVRLATNASVVPTAKRPVNNGQQLNNGESLTLVASPRAQSLSLGRSKNDNERYSMTTRVCTVRHYEECRAGSESSKDHFFGGVFVEIENGFISIEPIESDENGLVYFNGYEYLGDATATQPTSPVIVLGDLHIEKSDPYVWQETLKMLDHAQPSLVVCHDTLDFSSRNHHNRQSGRFLYQQGSTAVIDELTQVVKQLNQLAAISDLYIVASNHDDALSRWLDCPHYSSDQDPINAKTYHFMKLAILEMIDDGDDLEILELALKELVKKGLPKLANNITFGSVDEQFIRHNHELGMHGHIGQGGARGSIVTFKRFGMPTVTGHTHSGQRDGYALIVGVTGSFEMGYNKGMTTWTRDNAFLWPNGTAQLIPLFPIEYKAK